MDNGSVFINSVAMYGFSKIVEQSPSYGSLWSVHLLAETLSNISFNSFCNSLAELNTTFKIFSSTLS